MNNIVSLADGGRAVTTSLAIAEGVGNTHKSVIRLIRDNINDLADFGRVAFENAPFVTSGGTQNREVAILNEQHATLLMTYMRNNDVVREFKKRLIKAFFELAKQKQTPVDNLSRLQILQMAMQSEQDRLQLVEEKQALVQQIDEEAPRVAFAKQVEISQDAISIAKAAKILGTGRTRLFAYLRQIAWVTRRNEPYQTRIESGLLQVKLGSWDHPDHGLQQSVTALITGKGLAKLQKLWNQERAKDAA